MLSAAAGDGDMSGWVSAVERDEPLKLLRSSFSAFSKLDAGSDFASPLRSRDSIAVAVAVVVVVVVVGFAGNESSCSAPRIFVRFLDFYGNRAPELASAMDTRQLCGRAGPLDLSDSCTRTTWAALVPAVLVAALCLVSIPLPLPVVARKLGRTLKSPLDEFLTLREAEALHAGEPIPDAAVHVTTAVPLWRTIALAFVALVQALIWLSAGAYNLVTHEFDTWMGVCALLIGSTWVYGVFKPVFWPKPTAHLDLFWLYFVHLVFGVVLLGGIIYEHRTFVHLPLQSRIEFAPLIFNVVAIFIELALVSTMPMELPRSSINKEDIVSVTRPPLARR